MEKKDIEQDNLSWRISLAKRLINFIVSLSVMTVLFGMMSLPASGQVDAEPLETPIGTTFVDAEDSEQVMLTGSGWSTIWCDHCSGYQSERSAQAGDTASLTFEGVSISVVFLGDYSSGIVEITIDGQPYPAVDLINNAASDTVDPKEYVIATDLTPGQHTIELTVTGQKGFNFLWGNEAYVSIDGFRFGNFPFGTIEGRVLDPDGDGIYDADVEISSDSSVYTVHAARDGLFNLSGATVWRGLDIVHALRRIYAVLVKFP